VVIGGMLGYLTNRALQDRESATSASGAARVYQARLLAVAEDLTLMLGTRRAFDLGARVPPDLDVQDKRLMASELSADEWAAVVRSESSLRQLLNRNPVLEVAPVASAGPVGSRMDATTCRVLVEYVPELEAGANALSGLAGFDAKPTPQSRLEQLC
jgi:hypothetical protein